MLKTIVSALVVIIVSVGVSVLLIGNKVPVLGGTTHLSDLALTTLTVGTTGTQTSKVKWGTCTIFATSQTIAASSTQQVSCQGGSAALSAISGISAGDMVFVQQPTTTPTTNAGLVFRASASSTSGYIHMLVTNLTGTTYTWTAAASSSIPYFVLDN